MAPIAGAPVINSTTLAHVSEYEEVQFLRGSAHRMANGQIVRENISATVKLRFTLTWAYIDVTARNLIAATALNAITGGASVSYTSPRNLSYTVVLADEELPTWTTHRVANGAGLAYSGSLTLEEV